MRAFGDEDVVATFHRTPVADAQHLDLLDSNGIKTAVDQVRPDVVLLAAADAYVERCEQQPERTRRINVTPAEVFVSALGSYGGALVVFSSEYVFRGDRGPYRENDETAPLNEYGRQKVDLERVARALERHLICRTSGVFGWEAARKNFVCQLVDRVRAGGTIDVPNDQVITPTDVIGLAQKVRALVDASVWGVVHTAGPRVVPRLEFGLMVARAFGLPVSAIRGRSTAELAPIAPRPHDAGLSTERLSQLVGPIADPEDALSRMRSTER